MINKIFDLTNLQNESYIEGITDGKADDYPGDIRGEFVGYLSEKGANHNIPGMDVEISDHESAGVLRLFRDRVGARNLYYTWKDSVYVSTDLWWIVKQGFRSLNLDYIKDEYLEFQVPFSNKTFFDGVYRVMPGEIVTFDASGILGVTTPQQKKYWDVRDYLNYKQFNPNHLRDLLIDAVEWRKKIIGNNFTAYLSGGIDSSMVSLLSKPQHVFSGYYENKQYSETDYIESVLAKGRFHGNKVMITKEEFQSGLLLIPDILPDPQCGIGIIPQIIVARRAKNAGFSYSMSGEGGDELGLYPFNYMIIEQARSLRYHMGFNKFLSGWGSMCQKILMHSFPSFLATAVGRGPSKKKQVERIDSVWDYNLSVENNLFLFNINIGLPSILTIDEQVGIHENIIPVSPIVDHYVVEYIASVNSEERAKYPKFIFREAMEGILPDKVRLRSDKMGFPIDSEFLVWDGLPRILNNLRERDILDVPIFHILTRQAWAYVNIELMIKRLYGKPQE